jgi:hypothetical protein
MISGTDSGPPVSACTSIITAFQTGTAQTWILPDEFPVQLFFKSQVLQAISHIEVRIQELDFIEPVKRDSKM